MGMERMEGVDVHTVHAHRCIVHRNRIHLVYPVQASVYPMPAWAPGCARWVRVRSDARRYTRIVMEYCYFYGHTQF
jgi:hypothetical protein